MVNILERMETGPGWWETIVVSIFYDLIYWPVDISTSTLSRILKFQLVLDPGKRKDLWYFNFCHLVLEREYFLMIFFFLDGYIIFESPFLFSVSVNSLKIGTLF